MRLAAKFDPARPFDAFHEPAFRFTLQLMTKNILEGIQAAIERSLEQMAKTDDVNERKLISETIANLGDTVIGFMNAATDASEAMFDREFDDIFDGLEDEDDEVDPFER